MSGLRYMLWVKSAELEYVSNLKGDCYGQDGTVKCEILSNCSRDGGNTIGCSSRPWLTACTYQLESPSKQDAMNGTVKGGYIQREIVKGKTHTHTTTPTKPWRRALCQVVKEKESTKDTDSSWGDWEEIKIG